MNNIVPTEFDLSTTSFHTKVVKQKGFTLIFLLVGIIIVATIGSGAYFFSKSLNQPQPGTLQSTQNTPPSIPPNTLPTNSTPVRLSDDITEKIKVVPVNVVKFQKSIVDSDNCSNPIGLVSYFDKSTNAWMKINSELLPGNARSKKEIDDLLKFLDAGQQENWQDIDSFETVFRDYCGGHYSFLIRELEGISYVGTEKSRALMVLTGQSSWGEVTVLVYGKRGDNLIQLSKHLGDKALYANHIETCQSKNDNKTDYDKQFIECYNQAILSDKNIKQKARMEANKLVNLFAINQSTYDETARR